MREIPKKNYFILVVLLVVTVLITLVLSNLYLNQEKAVSSFYEYSNKLSSKEFEQFITENSDAIVYISDKYDLDNEFFEKKLKNKIDDLGLKKNLIFIDKNNVNKKFIKKMKKEYGINIKIEESPILLVIIDDKVDKNVIIDNKTQVDGLIEYEDFE